MSEPTVLKVSSINKAFNKPQGKVHVLEDVDFQVEPGEFITIIGPSGCGKSTLLKIIAGLDVNYQGTVTLGKQKIERPSIRQGFIFQEHRLFPWLTVEENIAADLSLKDPSVRAKVEELISIVRLQDLKKHIRENCLEVSPNGWRLPGRCCEVRKSYYWMNRSVRWTP